MMTISLTRRQRPASAWESFRICSGDYRVCFAATTLMLLLRSASRRFELRITAPHPIDPPHGLNSPVGRVYELDGQVLLPGVGHDVNTTIHLAESLAGVRYRRKKYVTVVKEGKATRINYQEIDHCCQNFNLVDRCLEDRGLQRKGHVGHAEAPRAVPTYRHRGGAVKNERNHLPASEGGRH